MAPNAQKKRSKHHAAFIDGLLRGDSVEAIARKAGVHRRTVTRWKAENAAEIEQARSHLVSDALAELRATLLSATLRLRHEVEDYENGSAGIRAALGVIGAHHDMTMMSDYGARLVALEARAV